MSVDVSKEFTWRPTTGAASNARLSALFERSSSIVLRYGLVVIILWFGLFKFTPTEAQSIQPLVANSPLLSWLYVLTSVQGVSRVIGITEIVIALLIAVRPLSARASALGGIGATLMFLTTLSFLLTTPGSWGRVDGFPVPIGPGGFLIKDVLLLGAALWTAGEALAASSSDVRHARR
jgi:reactive chlorine resistance protein C